MLGPETTNKIRQQVRKIREMSNEMPSASSILSPDSFLSVPGYLYPQEGYLLAELASARDVLEIGAHYGRSSVAMAYSANSITSIEHFKGDSMLGEIPKDEYYKHIQNSGASHKTKLVEADFFQLVKDGTIQLTDFDMFFYDGNHEPPEPYELHFFELIYAAMELSKDPKPRIVSCHDVKPAEPAFKWVVEAAEFFTAVVGVPMQGNAEHGSVRWWEVEF